MLRAVHSDRAEALFAALLEALPPTDPFAPSTVVVGGHLVSRWLTRELAFARGVAAGIELPTFDRFVERTWATDGIHAIDRAQLAAMLSSALADPAVVRALPQVASYLDAAPDAGDRAGPRRVQLAQHLARLVWSYAQTRPDWMPALLTGHVPSELEGDPTARWQAKLVAAAFARACADGESCALVPMLPWARRRAGHAAPRREGPIAVFGMPYLQRAQLEALTDLAQSTDVTVYMLDPCRELWDDVAGRRAIEGSGDPLPLILWGRPVRDTLAAMVERTDGDLDDRFAELAADLGTARARLLADVAARATAPAPVDAAIHAAIDTPAGVTVFACPNPRREIEAIAAEVRRALDGDPSLSAHQIAVWIAGDADGYLALAPSAFEAVGVPHHLVDAPIDDRGRIAEAMLALLELPTSNMARRDLLRVMTHPAVLAGYPHVDAADWIRWTERLGIAHGADAQAHAGTYLESYPDAFHWDQGVRRLALGAFMVGDRAERGPARIANLALAPEEVRPDQQASAATYALLVRSLAGDAAWLARHEDTLTGWADLLASLVDIYLAPRDQDAERDLERVRKMLAGIAHLDLDGRPVGFREAREHAARQLETARANRGEPLAAGVMIAPLSAMHTVPFEIAFVANLAEGEFPAGDTPSPLDLRRTSRPGDVSPRDRDRAAFLEVLLGTRRSLALSYVAVEPKSGQPLGPSSVVLELADALAPYLGAGSSRAALAQLTVRVPLHRFGGDAPGAVPAVARERWACRVRDAVRAHLRGRGDTIPDEDDMFALLQHPAQAELREALGIVEAPSRAAASSPALSLTIANLRGFLEYPIQAWAQAVLGLAELPDDAQAEHSDEPFHLDKPERASLLREVFARHLRDPARSLEQAYDTAVAEVTLRGQFPVGVFAEASRAVDLAMLDAWRTGLGLIPAEATARYGFGRAHAPGAILLPALVVELPDGRSARLTGQTELLIKTGDVHTSAIVMMRKLGKRSKYHLRGAFDHVVLAAAGIATAGHAHKLIDEHGAVEHVDHAPWTQAEALAYLAGLIVDLYDRAHGYMLPFDSLAKVLTGGSASYKKTGDMRIVLGYGPIDRPDALTSPPDARAIAERRLGPLVARFRGSNAFEGGRS